MKTHNHIDIAKLSSIPGTARVFQRQRKTLVTLIEDINIVTEITLLLLMLDTLYVQLVCLFFTAISRAEQSILSV